MTPARGSGGGPYHLDVDPDALAAAGRAWAELAHQLDGQASEITGTPAGIPTTAWAGKARTAICAEMTALGGQTTRFAEQLRTGATTLTHLASTCQDAQTEVAGLNRAWRSVQDTYTGQIQTLQAHQAQAEQTALTPGMDPRTRKLTRQDLHDTSTQARGDAAADRDRAAARLDGDYQELVDRLRARFRQSCHTLATATLAAVPDTVVSGFITGGGTGSLPSWCTRDGGIFPPDLHAEHALEPALPLLHQRETAADAARVTTYLQQWQQHPGPIDPEIAAILARRMSDPRFAGAVTAALGPAVVTQLVNRLRLPVDWRNVQNNPWLLTASNTDFPPGNPPYWQEVAAKLPPKATARQRAEAAANWFAGLTPVQQTWFVLHAPAVVGNLDGIPFAARDQANRIRLAQAHAELAAQLPYAPPGQDPVAPGVLTPDKVHLYDATWERLHTIQTVEAVMARPDRHLITFDMNGIHPTAAVAVGDLDTAHNVGVFTPGFTTTVASSLESYDTKLDVMREEARKRAYNSGFPSSTAMVTWIGYEAPQLGEVIDPNRSVGTDNLAEAGGKALNSFYTGIGAARLDDPHITALGHSYGSLTTSLALQGGGTGVDDVILFGSPGLGTDDVADLKVTEGHTFVLEGRGDPVADLGGFGPDPNQMDGVTELSAQAADTPAGHKNESTGHSDYLNGDTTSQYNMAYVIAGVPDAAVRGEHYGFGDLLYDLPGSSLARKVVIPWLTQ